MVGVSPPPSSVLGPSPATRDGRLSSLRSAYRPRLSQPVSLVLDIGQGAGLAGASGVRPFLPPLLAGALARADAGIDFDGSGWQFLESPAFLLAVVALAIAAYGAERSAANRRAVAAASALLAATLGALLFAGALAAGGHAAAPGIAAGIVCAVLALAAVGGLLDRAAVRLDRGSAGLLVVYADAAALALAALAIFVPPATFLALAAFALLLVRGRRAEGRKYAGLRILR